MTMRRNFVVTLRSVIKMSERFIIDNSPTILSGIAITGTLTVAYLTGKATFKAVDIIEREEAMLLGGELTEKMVPLPNKQRAKLVWKCYIPPAVAVVGTISCVVLANHINARRMAALAAAYKLSEKHFGDYKDKVKEIIGDKKEGEIRTAVAQDAVNNNPPGENIINAYGGETLCLDKWTGRYFRSDMQTIRAAENDINKGMYRGRDVATLGDFYDAIGLAAPRCAEAVGWNADAALDLTFDTVMTPGGQPCLVMDFAMTPFPIHGFFGHS